MSKKKRLKGKEIIILCIILNMQRVRELNRIISVHIKLDQLRYDCDMIWCGIRNVLYDTQSTSSQVKGKLNQAIDG